MDRENFITGYIVMVDDNGTKRFLTENLQFSRSLFNARWSENSDSAKILIHQYEKKFPNSQFRKTIVCLNWNIEFVIEGQNFLPSWKNIIQLKSTKPVYPNR